MFGEIKEGIEGFMKGAVKPVLDKFIVDADKRQEAENMIFTNAHAISLAQIEVNKEEAKSQKLFVAGWRPFVGWICGINLAYAEIGNDLLNWCLQVISAYTTKPLPLLPEPDASITLEILFALLGLAGMRTWEKYKGVHRKK
jgi:hypothetical protein